jgi:hypothetical protein
MGLEQLYNKPKLTGINHAVDFVAQRLNPSWFPTSGRTFLETMQGNREPITEANYTPAELQALQNLIQLKGGDKGSIQYKDYNKLGEAMRKGGTTPISMSPSLASMFDPLGALQTTVGRFNYAKNPQGNYVVVDDYDFNPPMVDGTTQEARNGDYGVLGPYGLIRDYAGEKVPTGTGRKVKIVVPK